MARTSFPLGFRFHPTDEELVSHYLRSKILGLDSDVDDVIPQVDINEFEPEVLSRRITDLSRYQSCNQNWYFFCRPQAQNPSGSNHRTKRKTESGFWKPTGKPRYVKSQRTNQLIGTKNILVFRKGPANNPTKTNWVIHEYHLTAADTRPASAQRDFVLCLLKKTSDAVEPAPAAALNNCHHTGHMAPDHESHASQGTILKLDPEQQAYHLEWIPEPTHQTPEFPFADEGMEIDADFDWVSYIDEQDENRRAEAQAPEFGPSLQPTHQAPDFGQPTHQASQNFGPSHTSGSRIWATPEPTHQAPESGPSQWISAPEFQGISPPEFGPSVFPMDYFSRDRISEHQTFFFFDKG